MSTEYPAIALSLANLDIISGSDPFRTAMGAFISVEEISDDEEYFSYSLFGTEYTFDELGVQYVPEQEGMHAIIPNFDLMEEINNLSFFNSYRVPCRIYEDTSFGFDNYLWWEAYIMGGEYSDKSYVGPLSQHNTVFGDHSIRYLQLPYHKYDSNIIDHNAAAAQGNNTISITPSYNRHYSEYLDYTNGVASERVLPNAYLFQTIEDTPEPTYGYADAILRFITLENAYPDLTSVEPDSLLDPVLISTYLPPFYSADSWDETADAGAGAGFPTPQFEDIDLNLRNYYSASLLRYPLSQSTINSIDSAMRNVIFDQNAVSEECKSIVDNISKIPFYIKIDFQSLNSAYLSNFGSESFAGLSYVRDLITEHNLSSKFMKDLKDLFGQISAEPSRLEDMTFMVEKMYTSASLEGSEDLTETNSETYRTLDFAEFINYSAINNISSQQASEAAVNPSSDCYFIGAPNIDRLSAKESTLLYAHYNSINIAHFVKDFEELSNTTLAYSLDKAALSTYSRAGTGASEELILDAIVNPTSYYAGPVSVGGDQHKYLETIAYRVEKIGGNVATGGSLGVLQDFWIAEGKEGDDILLYDSQIKYDQDYTYNVYAYVLVCGSKYSVDTVRLGRPSGIVGEEAADYEGWYCIQWYDPLTAGPETQLYETDEDNALLGINTFIDSTQSISKNYQYLADFYLNFEASAKIIEIPIATKVLKALDNPPNIVDVSPFQLMDNSQIIGFDIKYDDFTTHYLPPSPIMDDDYDIRGSYIHSLDMIDIDNAVEDQVNRISVSRQAAIEVYRVSEKPRSIADFDNQIISRIDLKIENSKNTLSQTIFYDKIATNRKYYYLFRAVNEAGIPGFESEIYEAELVDDGAFKYSIFEAYCEEDLDPTLTHYTEPSKSFKKLFMIKPNINQTIIDDTDADISNESHEEMQNVTIGADNLEETIWGNTFKLRLTSKKTGKKMDINITYKNVNQ
jgi:hypothetical protein